MMAITTNSSIRVKPDFFDFNFAKNFAITLYGKLRKTDRGNLNPSRREPPGYPWQTAH